MKNEELDINAGAGAADAGAVAAGLPADFFDGATAIPREPTSAERRAPSLARCRKALCATPKSLWPTLAMLATNDEVRLERRRSLARHFEENDLPEVARAMRETTATRGKILFISVGETSGVTVVALDPFAKHPKAG